MTASTISIARCREYQLESVHKAITTSLAPLGGIDHFVRPGMTVLLKPNLLTAIAPERAVSTHPIFVQAVAELAAQAGGEVWIGDSPNNSVKEDSVLWRKSGMGKAAAESGARLVPFSGSVWKQLNNSDYIFAKPVFQANLIINLPKLKTHTMTLYTGAIKNLFGCIPGLRKTAAHVRAPGIQDFSKILVDVLELVHPALTIMDGITGLEGQGPGASGTPHNFGCVAASSDAVALDAIMSRAMGFRQGEVLHVAHAGSRGLGNVELENIQICGDPAILSFGRLNLPHNHRLFDIPSWLSAPVASQLKLRPQVDSMTCTGCGTCEKVCPAHAITRGKPPIFDFSICIGCMCCAESCPEGAIATHRTLIGK